MIALDDETRWILGRPNFWCAPIARLLRVLGHRIEERAEDEQAATIHWMLSLYEEHGAGWRDKGREYLRAAAPPPEDPAG